MKRRDFLAAVAAVAGAATIPEWAKADDLDAEVDEAWRAAWAMELYVNNVRVFKGPVEVREPSPGYYQATFPALSLGAGDSCYVVMRTPHDTTLRGFSL